MIALIAQAEPAPTPDDVWAGWERLQEMGQTVLRQLPMVAVAVVVFFVLYFVAKGVRMLVHKVSGRYQRGRNTALVFGRLAQAGIVVLGLLIALVIAVPSINAGDVVGFLGISSVAIGFAFRDVLQNFLAGILLLLTEPFRIGDQIVYKDFEGTVEQIQTRATYMRTYDGRRVVIPNAELFTNAVTVNTAFGLRRLEYDVGIGYGDDISEARQLILEAMHEAEGADVLSDPAPDAIVVALAESSVNIRARWWVKPARQANALDQQDRVLEAIKNKLVANGIDLPFPTRQILFHDQTEETDGDRRRQREGWPAGKDKDVPEPRSIARALRRVAEATARAGRDGNGAAGDGHGREAGPAGRHRPQPGQEEPSTHERSRDSERRASPGPQFSAGPDPGGTAS